MFLNCHSVYSFRYGTLQIEQLFDEAKRCGIAKLALTDINNTSGYIELLRICAQRKDEHQLEIAVGIEFRSGGRLLYIGIARNNKGFRELNAFLSFHNSCSKPLPRYAPAFDNCCIIYPLERHPVRLRDNEFVGVKSHQLLQAEQLAVSKHQMIALCPVTVSNQISYNIHRLLRSIDNNVLLSKLPADQQCRKDECMRPIGELMQSFKSCPELLLNSQDLLEKCHFDFVLGENKNKVNFTGTKREDREVLMALAMEGFDQRYARHNHHARSRLFRELDIISRHNFEAYFLIAHDIVRYAEHRNFAHVGRGSGANSVTAYCLKITDVDPIELDLYFERFLNPERTSPPDFDIDFSWTDRDEITRYIIDKHGERYTALLATHSTFKNRSIVRELGKVFGLPKGEIDALVERPHALRERDHITRLIFRYASRMHEIPSHLSIHAGGVLITEEPIYQYSATDLPPKGFPVVHFAMHNAEDAGIYKLDILSQRGLGHIRDTTSIVLQNRGHKLDMSNFSSFKDDPKIKTLMRSGKTMGCFYVESPATRMLLGKLRCDDYLTLVAASSIIRPGVAKSGMMRAYIERHLNPGSYQPLHPRMDELMKDTYGVMVYQEDVIKVAHHFAGLSLAEADILRRGMSGKYRSRREFLQVKSQFFKNCEAKGYDSTVVERVWFEIESFAGYSFAKGHSASYAVESFQSLYLKAHYPLEFMVGVINNFGGFYRTEMYFHEARMGGARIEAPCVNNSTYLTRIQEQTIYIGFIHLKSLESRIAEQIPRERQANGAFTSFDNFVRRIDISLDQLSILVRIGALRFTGRTKRALLWEGHLYFGKGRTAHYDIDLFNVELPDYQLPALDPIPHEDAFDELELLQFPLCDPFDLLQTADRGNIRAGQLMDNLGRFVHLVGYLLTIKNTYARGGKLMHFATFYDDTGHVFDTTHFPPVARRYPFHGNGFYSLKGKVVEDFGYPMLEVQFMEKLPMVSKEDTNPRLKIVNID